MRLFGKGRPTRDGEDDGESGVVPEEAAAGPAAPTPTGPPAAGPPAAGSTAPASTTGPFDEADAPAGVTRIDLGALRVPPRPGMELRLELEDKTRRVVAATVGLAGSTVQLQAFAAPRRDGIWEEIRSEIATQVTKSGGSADEIPGSFGRELLARLPTRTSDGRTAHRPARFVGVDGPRWFLRAVFSGPAAADEHAARALEEVVRGTVVVRGTEAMAPRDLLPLRLPDQGGAEAQVSTSTDAATTAGP